VVKAIAALVIVLILAGALAASLIGSSVNSKPRNEPFGVVGSSALVSAVGKQVSLKPIRIRTSPLFIGQSIRPRSTVR